MSISDINQLSPEQIDSERTLALDRHINYFIFPHRLANGDIRTVEVHSTPITVSGAKLLFSIVHDITDRKQAEDELCQAKEVAVSANLAKSRFLSVVAHEFRSPLGLLTVSVGILDRYRDRLSNDKRQEQHDQIRNAARQMTQLIDSVLAFSRQETTSSPALLMMLDIALVCRSIAEEVTAVWDADHRFNIIIASGCGRQMMAEVLFRRVLTNLLINAFRFTPSGGTISLTVNLQADQLLIEVADTGIGIPDAEQGMIFDAFYRCSNVEARNGLGLGLSIVNEAVHQMNGNISLTSRVGKGSTFHVVLPMSNDFVSKEQQP